MRPGPSQPRGRLPTNASSVSSDFAITAFWSSSWWIGICTKLWPMNSQPASFAASATRGYSSVTAALIERVGVMPWRSRAAFRRQKPTRMPYSCQAQLGKSGTTPTPEGAGSTWRGIGRVISHTSRFTIGQTTSRAFPGSLSGARSTIAE